MGRTLPNPEPVFRIELQSLPSSIPVAIRLRMALKTLLRAYRFRAVKVEPLPDGPEPRPTAAGQPEATEDAKE